MSLQRYINNETILVLNTPQYGKLYSDHVLKLLDGDSYIPMLNFNLGDIVSELHIYTYSGDYVGSNINSKVEFDTDTKNVLIDVRNIFKSANITKGTYKVVSNLIYPTFGYPNYMDTEAKDWPVFIKEISPDKDEIAFSLTSNIHNIGLANFKTYASSLVQIGQLNNIVVNFGQNRIYKIINIRFDEVDPNVFYIKINGALDLSIVDLDKAWFGVELIDSYIDTIILTSKIYSGVTNQLKGPKFYMDVDDYNSQATVYQSWDELLDSDVDTSQRIIDSIISGSGYATINIDYTDFNNFVFYSSAKERVENFREKMLLIERYTDINNSYLNSSGSTTSHVLSTIDSNKNRINNLITSFDPYERWMYHHSTSSLFTHDLTGSLTPWPKYISGSSYVNHHVTSSIVEEWYNGTFATASYYDLRNVNSLYYSIPEHILMNQGNNEYVSFVNMVGHHFDTLYSYINALTDIHNKDEHPERGASNELLFDIAKSFGWNLQNTRQLSDLWLYKLGTDSTGSMMTSSDMDVLPYEGQTKMIWKRIVNSLPYLLKTKGTSRSVKALMSIYGIPNTLLSIKEYGGPSLDIERPIAIEDFYAYKLIVSGGAHVKIPRDTYNAKSYGWGNGVWCGSPISSSQLVRDPDTIEFRFSIPDLNTGSSGPILLYATQFTGSHASTPNQFIYALSVIPSAVISGSDIVVSGSTLYGKVQLETFTSQSTKYSGSSIYLPVFDGDMWTVRITNTDPFRTDVIAPYGPLQVNVSRTSDCLYGRPTFSSSFEVASGHSILGPGFSYLGGLPSASLANLNISSSFDYINDTIHVQGYKEYFTTYSEETFYTHVLNPRAYNTDSESGSFYSLYRYYPLGLDEQRWDHSTGSYLFLSSSHPDRSITHGYAEFVGFSGGQTTQYESLYETAYIRVPSIGGTVLYSDKVRLEDLESRFELSPDTYATVFENDDESLDTNRLAIVFSLADHINRDIFNHMGPKNLDSWIGDPEYEFSSSYQLLNSKKNEYYQKYQQRNDINSFIRILSVFDYTFFEQLKQLVPARADLITGILIEPTILDRVKVELSKRPSIEDLSYEQTIDLNIASQSGDYLTFEKNIIVSSSVDITFDQFKGVISSSFNATSRFDYATASIKLNDSASSQFNYITSSISNPFIVSSSGFYDTIRYVGEVEVLDPYTGTTSSLQTNVSGSVVSCVYKRKLCYYDAYLIKNSYIQNPIFDNFDFWWTGSNVSIMDETSSFVNANTYRLSNFLYLSGSTTIPSRVSQSLNTVSGSRYLIRYYARPYDLVAAVTSSITVSSSITNNVITLATSSLGQWIKEYRIEFIGSGQDSIVIGTSGSLAFYSFEVYDYLSPYDEQWRKLAYKETKQPSYCIEESWNYQINECSSQNNSRFEGSKLTGAGINIDSSETIDGGPVVTVIEVNPNSGFSENQGESNGNFRLK